MLWPSVMYHGSCGSWVNSVMGHMGHGSRKMTHFHLCHVPRYSGENHDGDHVITMMKCDADEIDHKQPQM